MIIDGMTISEVWNEINKQLNENPEPFKGMNVSYSFNLSGDDGGLFGLKLENGAAEIIIGELDHVDCAFFMSVSDFKKLLGGNLNTTVSFMTGKLKVKGNLGLALKLENLLKSYI